MRFSLVIGTMARTTPFERFLHSLDAQSHRDFELIVVDQNPDDRLVPMVRAFKKRFTLCHMKSDRGLSRARNAGMKNTTGDVVAFPDDDCWYPPELLERVASFFKRNPEWDGITGRPTDELGRCSMGRFDSHPGRVSRLTLWTRLTSFTIFLKRHVVNATGEFDTTLGVGSGTPWGSAEEMDYIIRALRKGFRLWYDPSLVVFHPLTVPQYDDNAANRYLYYGAGAGRVLRLHMYPLRFVARFLLRPLGGAVIGICLMNYSRARYHLNGFRGRLRGYLAPLTDRSTGNRMPEDDN